MILKSDEARYRSADLTLTFGPGVVRYLDPLTLVVDDGLLALSEISAFNVAPSIKFPTWNSSPHDIGIETVGYGNCNFKYSDFASLFEKRFYKDIIGEISLIFKSYSKSPFPSEAYCAFSQYTGSSQLVLSEFLKSWVSETLGNHDLASSFANSEDHLLLYPSCSSIYVFKKTDYLVKCRSDIDAAAEKLLKMKEEDKSQERARDLDDAIRKAYFDVFTYLMEDTRNGMIKIGKSKNPERREKTLQSEAPSIEMRIAVPTESDFESILHDEFDHLRRRGEWFELSSLETKNVIERLLAHGDSDRAITCHEWLGRVFLAAYSEDSHNRG